METREPPVMGSPEWWTGLTHAINDSLGHLVPPEPEPPRPQSPRWTVYRHQEPQ